ncbi:hypothetical protein KSC_010500 [Ktedonobacter sp. SOSP1-52]|uniref:PhnD/SsuA/transferrin family substrate-binding protein n=1 Tax=Ktedonobacter sp. SOSP1-52 TaxID=2778366 RepID=UPI0019162086|nr:PhnD/SsuA/transferrin family substrate-binding protein [Ktedonobacter sp. SOSP1-52]GHO62158.1 hypothetical protein KSC_010500 [Ktedonobacter sp. SOSP1-52]
MTDHQELRVATYLSPLLYETYAYITRYLGERLGLVAMLRTGETLEELITGEHNIAFLCGLLYVRLRDEPSSEVELLTAPTLHGERYQGRTIYFSDIVVRQESPYTTFTDLYGSNWAYNEFSSHSGYNLVRYNLYQRGLDPSFFRSALATGSHLQSLQAVHDGRADVTAIDSHVLDVLRLQRPDYVAQFRIIDAFGPSGVPPLVISTRLEPQLRQEIRAALLSMHLDPEAAQHLQAGRIERFIPVADCAYDDIRHMSAITTRQ